MKRVLCGTAAAVAWMCLTCTAQAASTGWTITDLGSAHNVSTLAMNDQAWVVMGNQLLTPDAGGYAVTELLSTAGNANNFSLRDVNNAGVVLGVDSSSSTSVAFVWQAGVRTDLPRLPNFDNYRGSVARGINDSGQVVGNTGDTAVVWSPTSGGGYQVTPLGVDLGWTIGSGDGTAINSAGVGLMSQVYNSYRTGYSTGVGYTSIIPEMSGYTPVGTAINDASTVVGYGACVSSWCNRPFVWQGAEVSFLPAISSGVGTAAVPHALNEHGQVVGEMYYAGYDLRAVLWEQGASGWGLTDLNTLLPQLHSSFYQLAVATDVNESGQILGMGSVAGDWRPHAFLLTPAVPEPQAWALVLAGLGVLGWRRRLARQPG